MKRPKNIVTFITSTLASAIGVAAATVTIAGAFSDTIAQSSVRFTLVIVTIAICVGALLAGWSSSSHDHHKEHQGK